ncbi:MAG: DNA methyltransferase [Chloroflexota bacterium]
MKRAKLVKNKSKNVKTTKRIRVAKDSRAIYLPPATEAQSQYGTFADSKHAPVHRWFQYPAGFSYRAVEYVLEEHGIAPGKVVYDPFAGTATTLVVCKSKGVESYGVEAHPFVFEVASVKTFWDYGFAQLDSLAARLILEIRSGLGRAESIDLAQTPELVRKCFSDANLRKLLFIRARIQELDEPYRAFFTVALTCALRQASGAATGWPYIAPKKRIQEKDGVQVFTKQVYQMISDLKTTPAQFRRTPCHLVLGDARHTEFEAEKFDLSFTSPPYLNNYDYADRTRLETYFNGFASTWGDITEKVRSRLIMSATTQINRSDFDSANIISDNLREIVPDLAADLQSSVNKLSRLRLTHGGKKSYDIMIGQYFNDMTLALADNYRVLKPGTKSIWILGDSAPYGVHISTEEILGRIGLALGFRSYTIQQLRKRGDKWKGNTQRHHVALKESILTLTK